MTDDIKFVEEVSEAFKSDQFKWNAFTMARLIDLASIGAAAKPRPISEAPKNGTDVLLWCGWWITGKWAKRSGSKDHPTWVTEDASNTVFMVTHYSNLPPPPPEQ